MAKHMIKCNHLNGTERCVPISLSMLFRLFGFFLSNDYIVMWVFGWHDHKIAGCAGETDMLLWHELSLASEIENANQSNPIQSLLVSLFFNLECGDDCCCNQFSFFSFHFAVSSLLQLLFVSIALNVFVFLDSQRKTCSFRFDWMRCASVFDNCA